MGRGEREEESLGREKGRLGGEERGKRKIRGGRKVKGDVGEGKGKGEVGVGKEIAWREGRAQFGERGEG